MVIRNENRDSVTWALGLALSFLTVYHGISVTGRGGKGAESRRLQGALRFGPRSTTDASTFPPGPSRSDGVPHVSHVLIKV